MEYNYRFLFSIAISLLIISGWEFFFIVPNQDSKIKIERSLEIKNQKSILDNFGETLQNNTKSIQMTSEVRSDIIHQSPRITIDTPELTGSINLIGGKIDDLFLKNYHIKVDKNSPNISLLNPNPFKESYFVELGFTSRNLKEEIPTRNTLWKRVGNNYQLTPKNPIYITFDNKNGLIFQRKISIDNQYMFTFEDSIKNLTNETISLASYGSIVRSSPKETENSTYLLHEGMIGVIGNQGLKTKTYHELHESKVINFQKAIEGWIGITDKYWAVILIPSQREQYKSRFSFKDTNNEQYQADILQEEFSIQPGKKIKIVNRVFTGAKKVDIIDEYQKMFQIEKFTLLIDWGFLHFITKPMFILIDWLYKLVNNFGIAILLVTVILKILFFPLANKSYKSMARMKQIQPLLYKIREKYPEDKMKQQQAIVELYRKENINPLAGCWPILVQFPIFFALYKVLYITIEMRHAPFFSWIQDLASPDPTSLFNLFGVLPYDVPYFLKIGFWPIIMGITMFLQMRMNPLPEDKTQAMVLNWMPLVFTWMLASFPVGLVIYWAWNNTLSIIQQAIIMKKQNVRIELLDNLKKIFQ